MDPFSHHNLESVILNQLERFKTMILEYLDE